MKQLITFLLFIPILACTKKHRTGDWDDFLHLTPKETTLKNTGGTITVTSQSTFYWFNEFNINGDRYLVPADEIPNLAFSYKTNSYSIQKLDDGKKIVITLSPNTTGTDRILSIRIQGGDYFDAIKITQSK